ncbi:MAG: hypothetical protein ACREH8_22775 [Opitutaceae bacterium]
MDYVGALPHLVLSLPPMIESVAAINSPRARQLVCSLCDTSLDPKQVVGRQIVSLGIHSS